MREQVEELKALEERRIISIIRDGRDASDEHRNIATRNESSKRCAYYDCYKLYKHTPLMRILVYWLYWCVKTVETLSTFFDQKHQKSFFSI